MDLEASTITNKSILVATQGTPTKVILGNCLIVGGAVGTVTVGEIVGRLVGAAVVLMMHVIFGHTIPALSTKNCSFNVPNFPVIPSFDAIQVKQVLFIKFRENGLFNNGGLYRNGDIQASPLGFVHLLNQQA